MTLLTLQARTFVLAIEHTAAHAVLVGRLLAFLAPHFREVPDVEPDLLVVLCDPADFPESAAKACTGRSVIRESSSPHFNLSAQVGADSGRLVAWDGSCSTGYVIDRENRRVDLFAGDGSFFHLIELVRYYGLRVEEARGALILHSSAVVSRSGEALAVVGAKGAGKTSTLIALVGDGRHQYLSGDKLIVRAGDAGPSVSGWPDYPHIGLASLAAREGRFQDLIDTAKHAPRTPGTDKILIPPETFRAAFPIAEDRMYPLKAVILPDVRAAGDFRVAALSRPEKTQVPIEQLVERPGHFVAATWHGIPLPPTPASSTSEDATWDALYRLPWESWSGVVPDGQTVFT